MASSSSLSVYSVRSIFRMSYMYVNQTTVATRRTRMTDVLRVAAYDPLDTQPRLSMLMISNLREQINGQDTRLKALDEAKSHLKKDTKDAMKVAKTSGIVMDSTSCKLPRICMVATSILEMALSSKFSASCAISCSIAK